MSGVIFSFFVMDHVRLDSLLHRSVERPGAVVRASFDSFRVGLFRHIELEEQLLLASAQQANGGQPLEVAARLKLEHSAIRAVLLLKPTRESVAQLRALAVRHNPLEENPSGLYDLCDQLLADQAEAVLARARTYPNPAVAPYRDDPQAIGDVKEALAALDRPENLLRR